MNTITLYRYPLSGHSHRVELFLSLLGLEATLINVDLAKGEHRQSDFIEKNAFGQVPVLEDGAVTLADSNAILVYLASKYDPMRCWLPTDPLIAAKIQQMLSLAAGPLVTGPASARLVNVFGAQLDHEKALHIAHHLLGILDDRLMDRLWLVTDRPTIADIAMYTYIAHAPEGGVSLQRYGAVRYWLKRLENLPGFVGMKSTPVGLQEK